MQKAEVQSSGMLYLAGPFSGEIARGYSELLPHQNASNAAGKLRWKYEQNPSGCGLISTVASDGDIIGMIGGVATKVRLGSQVFSAVQALDTIVSPRARGKGAFIEMGRALHEEASRRGINAEIGFPNANAASGWFGKLGWTNLGTAPFLFKPIRSGFFSRRIAKHVPSIPLAFPRRSRMDVRRIDRFDERATRVWQSFAGERICGVDRSDTYLNWRLMECPSASYDCYGIFDEERLRSFVATRTTDKHGGRLAYVMEALGDETLVGLVEDSISRAKDDGAEAVLAWCTDHSPNRQVYNQNGFFTLPKRFAPEIHFGGRALVPHARPLFDSIPWYLSYLDSDTV